MTNISQVMRVLAELKAEIAALKEEIHTLKAEKAALKNQAHGVSTPKTSKSTEPKESLLQRGLNILKVYLTEKQLAARWEISIKTLQLWRWQGIGIRYCKLGRSVRYRLSDIEAYESQQERASTAQAA